MRPTATSRSKSSRNVRAFREIDCGAKPSIAVGVRTAARSTPLVAPQARSRPRGFSSDSAGTVECCRRPSHVHRKIPSCTAHGSTPPDPLDCHTARPKSMRVAAFPRTTKMLFARGLLEEAAAPEEGRQAPRITAAGLRAIGIAPEQERAVDRMQAPHVRFCSPPTGQPCAPRFSGAFICARDEPSSFPPSAENGYLRASDGLADLV